MDPPGLTALMLHQDISCRAYMLDVVDEVHSIVMQAGISKLALMFVLKERQMSPDTLHYLRATGRPLKNGGVGIIIAIGDKLVLKVRLQQC
jgi:hypothetical protein